MYSRKVVKRDLQRLSNKKSKYINGVFKVREDKWSNG